MNRFSCRSHKQRKTFDLSEFEKSLIIYEPYGINKENLFQQKIVVLVQESTSLLEIEKNVKKFISEKNLIFSIFYRSRQFLFSQQNAIKL